VGSCELDVVGAILSSAVALGLGLLSAWALAGLGDLAGKVRRFFRPRISLQAFVRQQQEERAEVQGERRPAAVLSWIPLPAGIALAVGARDWLLSPYLAVVGAGLAYYMASRRSRKEQGALTEQVKSLVLLFRSRYAIGESPFAVLVDVLDDMPDGRVKGIVRRAVDSYHATGDGGEALALMRRVHNHYLSRLVMILEASGSAETDVILVELKELEDDLKNRDRLAGQARATLALLRGTVSFLQVANLTAVAASVALPLWHDFFTSALQRRGTFLAATMFLLVASLFFDQEIALQEDRVL